MDKIVTFIWFSKDAADALAFYTSQLPDSAVTATRSIQTSPAGPIEMSTFTLAGREFQAMQCGSPFETNQAHSIGVWAANPDDVEHLWEQFLDGALVRIPLDTYPFAERYGWLRDRFGIEWQFGVDARATRLEVLPCLLFSGKAAGQAEDAILHWTSVFPGSRIDEIIPRDGMVDFAKFSLAGTTFTAMDDVFALGADFNESVSLMVRCTDQAELTRVADALSTDPTTEQCGWLKDRFGVSWQIVPDTLDETMFEASDDELDAVTALVWSMKRLDMDALTAARTASRR